jgi:hypothetical protein
MKSEIPSETLQSFADATEIAPSDDALKSINILAKQQMEIEDEIASLEAKLKEKKEALKQVSEILIPGAMIEAGCEMYRLSNGYGLEIKPFVSASLPKDPEKRERAFQWLDETGNNDMQHGFVPSKDQTIHPQTLKAFIKEQLEIGVGVPMDLFNAYLGRKAKINRKD